MNNIMIITIIIIMIIIITMIIIIIIIVILIIIVRSKCCRRIGADRYSAGRRDPQCLRCVSKPGGHRSPSREEGAE